MLRKSGSVSRHLGLIFTALFAAVLLTPGLTLFRGQVIKQFETYSLARSMTEVGFNPYATTIPCDGGIRWVLELPIYAGLGGAFVALAPAWAALWPTLVFGLFLYALVRLRRMLAPESGVLPWIAVAATPVFLRFSNQFLADPFAVALLALGAAFFLERRARAAFGFFLLAVSVKPTVLPAILFFRWAFAPERPARAWLPLRPGAWLAREAGLAALLVLPFAAWTISLRLLEIPTPLHEGGLLAIGSDWGILASRVFYSKFFVWTVFKGVGIPLFLFGLFAYARADVSERTLRLAAWSIGIIPYWILVRRLNVIHDYYSLSFFLPIALLGALGADEFARRGGRARRFAIAALGLTVGQGLFLYLQSAREGAWLPPVAERPVFCGLEMRPQSLMNLPRKSAAP